jgi:hypothetical protein
MFCLESFREMLKWPMGLPRTMQLFFLDSFREGDWSENRTDKIYHDFDGRK